MSNIALNSQKLKEDIQLFETNIQSENLHTETGINIDMFKETGTKSGSVFPSIVYLNSDYLKVNHQVAQQFRKKHKSENLQRRQANERRRGKLIGEFESSDNYDANTNANDDISSQLFILSNAEAIEQYNKDVIQKYKVISQINYENHELRIQEFSEKLLHRIEESSHDTYVNEMDVIIPIKLSSQMSRMEDRQIALAAAYHQDVVEEVERIIDRILDVAVWVLSVKEMGAYSCRDADFPEFVWDNGNMLFDSPLSTIKSLPFPVMKPLHNPHSTSRHFINPIMLHHIIYHTLRGVLTDGELPPVVMIEESDDDNFRSLLLPSSSNTDISLFQQEENFNELSSLLAKRLMDQISAPAIGGDVIIELNEEYSLLLTSGLTEQQRRLTEPISLLFPPNIFFTTPTCHLLGEIIVHVHSAAAVIEPLPSPRVPVVSSHVRVLLLGGSPLARANAATYIQDLSGATIVSLQILIEQWIAKGEVMENEFGYQEYLGLVDSLVSGEPLSTSLCVSLIVMELTRLQNTEDYKGYVLKDFPTSLEETIQLLQALSGIDYSTFSPHPKDTASPYAATGSFERSRFQASQSGLTAVFSLVESDMSRVIVDSVTSRYDLETGAVSYLEGSLVVDVELLVEHQVTGQSKHTMGLEAEMRREMLADVTSLLSEVGLLVPLFVTAHGLLDVEATASIQNLLLPLVIGGGPLVEDSAGSELIDDGVAADALVEENEVVQSIEQTSMQSQSFASLSGSVISEPIIQLSTTVGQLTELSPRLALILSNIWGEAEAQSREASLDFFRSLQEVRLMTVLRRRLSQDILGGYLARNDEKHALVGALCDEYNAIDYDFRFDVDCKAEFSLRALELRDELFRLSGVRRGEVEEVMRQLGADAMPAAQFHRLFCEGAVLLQAELNRFTAALHLIFDFSKALGGRLAIERYATELEETVPSPHDPEMKVIGGSKGKDAKKDSSKPKEAKKNKKGEAAEPFAYREAVAKSFLTTRMMELPGNAGIIEDDKKKVAAAKSKKPVKEELQLNPFEQCENYVREVAQSWCKEVFKVNRQLYRQQESLCVVVENAVWYETDRLLLAVSLVREQVYREVKWIEETEIARIEKVAAEINTTYLREISTADALVMMLFSAIDACEAIPHRWFIAADAIIIEQQTRITPAPLEPVVPIVNTFFTDRLNTEQKEILVKGLKNLLVNGKLYEEDLRNYLESLELGTLGVTSVIMPEVTTDGFNVNMSLPDHWTPAIFPVHLMHNLIESSEDSNHEFDFTPFVNALDSYVL